MQYFQILDNKKSCSLVYHNNQLSDINGIDFVHYNLTYNYDSRLKNYNHIKYAKLYCAGQSLRNICPEYLRSDFDYIDNKIKAYLKSFKNAKININKICLYDLIPQKHLLYYCDIKNRISRYVFENYKCPENYDFIMNVEKLLTDIKERKLNISDNKYNNYIDYNQFKSITGRLTTNKGSFPILSLNKELRHIISPVNDYFVELDYNSCEARVLLALSNIKQPDIDIHEYNRREIFNNNITRDESKKKFFRWLYDDEYKDKKLEKQYPKNEILEKYYINGEVKTPYKKVIKCDKKHALNYLIQSTAASLFLEQTLKIYNLLNNEISFISFLMPDSVILDVKKLELDLIKNVIDTFKKTRYDDFRVNIKIGKNYGEMRKILDKSKYRS